jgi:hypothetical protein
LNELVRGKEQELGFNQASSTAAQWNRWNQCVAMSQPEKGGMGCLNEAWCSAHRGGAANGAADLLENTVAHGMLIAGRFNVGFSK